MGMIKSFKDLTAWQEGHKLVISIYKETECFPVIEQFRLTRQLRRSAVSVTSNLAEGFSRSSRKEKIQFYSVSQGSLSELSNQLQISKDVGYMSDEAFEALTRQLEKVGRLVSGLTKSASSKPIQYTKYQIQDTNV